MEECIIKKDTITLLKNVGAPQYAINAVEMLAKPVEVIVAKHGRWYDTGFYDAHKSPIYQCSYCRREVADYYIKNHKYCLHCGAQMDGE